MEPAMEPIWLLAVGVGVAIAGALSGHGSGELYGVAMVMLAYYLQQRRWEKERP